MKIYDYLDDHCHYEKNSVVEGVVYQVNPEVGVFVAVEGRSHGMIPIQNVHKEYRIGDHIEARVVKVREDGKVELNTQERVEFQMDKDAMTVMEVLESYDGVLPFSEKASPEVIERELGMSKAAFKRAVGRLFKNRKILIENHKIRKNMEK